MRFLIFSLLFCASVNSELIPSSTTIDYKHSEQEKRPEIGVGVIVEKGGKILLGKRKGAHGAETWAPPGGHLEFGETTEACAYRELAEETGLKALSSRLGPWTQNVMERGQKHYVTNFVFVDQFEGDLQLLEPEKCEGWDWFEWDQLPSPLFPSMNSLVENMNEDDHLRLEAERIHLEWDKALSKNDIDAFLALYAPDATIESPLIPHLTGREVGICKGHGEIRQLVEKVAERKPSIRKFHRNSFFTDGKTLMWEYPRSSPDGDQMDFVEVMEIKDGLICYHRVYWGWFGVKVIENNAYHR